MHEQNLYSQRFQGDVERVLFCSMVMLSPEGLYLLSHDSG